MRISWTAGALRAFERAGQSAASQNCGHVEPSHLLWALWCEETRAAEILQEFSLNDQHIHEICPGQQEQLELQHDIPPDGSNMEAIRIAASDLLAKVGGSSEVGTEFLLWGLFEVDSPVATAMRSWGITESDLTTRICRSSGIVTEPIAVDFQLDNSPNITSPVAPRPTTTSQAGVERLLDAAGNRAREGLRVVEDAVRFLFNDRVLTEQLKSWRHDLRTALDSLDSHRLLESRDTTGDVGTTVQTAAEFHRQSVRDIITANFKRTQEALRSLEEFGKLRSAQVGQQFEQLRYRLYTLERDVIRSITSRSIKSESGLHERHLYVLLTESVCRPRTLEGIIESLSPAEIAKKTIVQIREKSMPDRELLSHARKIRQLTRDRDIVLIMNDRPDLAVLCDADGVHVGQEELTAKEARQIVGPNRLVGVSTHTIEQARQAVDDGADYIGVGPVFTSQTKTFSEFAGLEFVRQVAEEIPIPWYAIGGITNGNIETVIAAGAKRVAVCHDICGSNDPAQTASLLLSKLTITESE